MSIELFAKIEASAQYISDIANILKKDESYLILNNPNPSRILLRLKKNPPRVDWPEDVELNFSAEGIFLIFHSANSDDRTGLVRILESTLLKHGKNVCFEEE